MPTLIGEIVSSTLGASIQLADLVNDPYPAYKALRQSAPVAYVSAANRVFVTRYKDILQIERQPAIYSSMERESLMLRAIGQTMLRLDGEAHQRIRRAVEPSLRQSTVRSRWTAAFQRIADDLIDRLIGAGRADLFSDFAGPCAATCLARLLGLHNSTHAELRRWSQAIIDGCGNYGNDADIWQRCAQASAEITLALEDMIPFLTKNPDDSVVSAFIHSREQFTFDEIKANVMVIIGGGLNEPRDAIAAGTYALLLNPDQKRLVESDDTKWMNVFEEAVRWISPVGMYPRQTTQRVELGGTTLEEGTRIGVIVASGNRDESVFDDADTFDISRPKRPNLAFGGGAHYCLGVWSARVQVGEVALPTLFQRLRNLRLVDAESIQWTGWVFRGPNRVPVEWTVQ